MGFIKNWLNATMIIHSYLFYNMGMSNAMRRSYAGGTSKGCLPTMSDSAHQTYWILDNSWFFVYGGIVDLSGGAIS